MQLKCVNISFPFSVFTHFYIISKHLQNNVYIKSYTKQKWENTKKHIHITIILSNPIQKIFMDYKIENKIEEDG